MLTLKPGKSDFNRFKIGKEILEPCVCKYNLDFNFGCLSNINPYLTTIGDLKQRKNTQFHKLDSFLRNQLKDTVLKPAFLFTENFSTSLKNRIRSNIKKSLEEYKKFDISYLEKYLHNGIGLLDGKRNGCSYCYAKYKNNSQKILPYYSIFTAFSKIEEQLKEIQPEKRIIRLGKETECLSIVHLELLDKLLDTCLKYGARIIAPTKFLYFEPTIADKLKRTKSVIGYSLFSDIFEPGPSNWGFDTDFRLYCAKRYALAGVKTVLKITMDCTASFDRNAALGIPIYKYLKFLEKNPKVGRQLIPLRIHQKALAHKATGFSKKELSTGIQNLFKESIKEMRYMPYYGGAYIPTMIHQDFKDFFGKHICGKIGHTFYCDSCGFGKAYKIDMDAVEVIPVTYTNNRRRGKPSKDRNQLTFALT